MTSLLDRPAETRRAVPGRKVISGRQVWSRRLAGLLLVSALLGWALWRGVPPGGDVVNRGGAHLVGDLFASALHPSLAPDFLRLVAEASAITVAFATLGTAGALLIGFLGAMVLSDVAWARTPSWPVRALRLVLRAALVAIRSVHELVWALLFVSVLGLDPLVAVLAIALPFGAQTAQVFAQTIDAVPPGPLRALRNAGVPLVSALAYALLPASAPLLLSYSFYRFECAIRSTVLLGVVGVGGLGQAIVVSLQSRNWDEVWTLIGAVVLLSGIVDWWSGRVRAGIAVVSCADWSSGRTHRAASDGKGSRGVRPAARWIRLSPLLLLPGVAVAWLATDLSLAGLTTERTRELAGRLMRELWPPKLPGGGWPGVIGAALDTLAMAVLAMVVAVLVTLVVAPWATSRRQTRTVGWLIARVVLLLLRSVPPTVWAVVALLVLFPGVLPGALALGLYTGGILGRLVAEAWESIDTRARDALRHAGVRSSLASIAATLPPSLHQLLTYTLYRFEICVRDTAVVGVVGAAGLGRLLAENLAVFRFPVVTTLLAASCVLSILTEVAGRRIRRAINA